MIEFISGLMEVLEYLFRGLFGFRYIFSRKYRRDAHVRWRKNKFEAAGEIFVSLVGMGLIGVGVYFNIEYVIRDVSHA